MSAPSAYADSQKRLAEALDISRQTLRLARRDYPDYPKPHRGKWDVAEVRAFLNSKGIGVKAEDSDKGTIAERKLNWKLRNEALIREAKRDDGLLLEKSEVYRVWQQVITDAMGALRQKFENELPPQQEGRDAREIKAMNTEALNSVFKFLNEKAL